MRFSEEYLSFESVNELTCLLLLIRRFIKANQQALMVNKGITSSCIACLRKFSSSLSIIRLEVVTLSKKGSETCCHVYVKVNQQLMIGNCCNLVDFDVVSWKAKRYNF